MRAAEWLAERGRQEEKYCSLRAANAKSNRSPNTGTYTKDLHERLNTQQTPQAICSVGFIRCGGMGEAGGRGGIVTCSHRSGLGLGYHVIPETGT